MFISSISKQFVLSCGCVTILLLGRFWYTHSFFYGFLLWNLMLAYIPYIFSEYATNQNPLPCNGWSRAKWWLVFFCWLLFLPNAPYIITDFVHLARPSTVPKWYDAALLFTAAGSGLWIGFISLLQMEKRWKQIVAGISSGIFIPCVFLLCGFGIYLGRVVRLNSWEIVTNPGYVIQVISSRIVQPLNHLRTWAFTGLFALVLSVFYRQMKQLLVFKYINIF